MSNAIPVTCNWLCRSDLPSVLAIERMSFAEPWDYETFCKRLSAMHAIAKVAETVDHRGRGRVVGYVMYEEHARRIDIVRLAVHPAFRRAQVASQIVTDLVLRRLGHEKLVVRADIDERMLEGQLLFRHLLFKAVRVLRHSDGDTYRMELRHPAAGGIDVDCACEEVGL